MEHGVPVVHASQVSRSKTASYRARSGRIQTVGHHQSGPPVIQTRQTPASVATGKAAKVLLDYEVRSLRRSRKFAHFPLDYVSAATAVTD
ncbi:MAG: hypothetical protein Q9162_006386 [Coniocarpon cinnabarinum]